MLARHTLRFFLFSLFLQPVLVVPAQEDPVDAEPVVQAVQRVLPAVVNINTERVVQQPASRSRSNRQKRAVRQTVQSLGSGFVVDPAGYIITNEHVVERAAELKIKVTFPDGRSYDAKYVTGDPVSDLALIKVDVGQPLPSIDMTNLSPNRLGQTVIVVGNPLGYESTITRGVLSGKARKLEIDGIEYSNLLQSDAAINPGNSGGPMIDIAGRLVGISSVKLAFTPDGVPAQGIGFAIPADFVRAMVAEFRRRPAKRSVAQASTQSDGAAKRMSSKTAAKIGWERFGIGFEDIEPDASKTLEFQVGRGVLVGEVEPESPAAEAGIKRGLVIYKVGRYEVNSTKELEPLLKRVKTGTVIDLAVGIIARTGDEFRQQIETVTVTAR